MRGLSRAIYAVTLSQLRRPPDAEDAMQDTFVQILLHISDCREPGKFSSWALSIARNVARNLRERRALRDVALASEEAGVASAGDGASPKDLVRALMELDETEAEVLLLADLEDWSHREIAEVLGISEVASRQHAFVARRKLRERLGGEP
jgi:RNA polymerase sigma factor (sigma-70 family)